MKELATPGHETDKFSIVQLLLSAWKWKICIKMVVVNVQFLWNPFNLNWNSTLQSHLYLYVSYLLRLCTDAKSQKFCDCPNIYEPNCILLLYLVLRNHVVDIRRLYIAYASQRFSAYQRYLLDTDPLFLQTAGHVRTESIQSFQSIRIQWILKRHSSD